jgi:hypothetical protein
VLVILIDDVGFGASGQVVGSGPITVQGEFGGPFTFAASLSFQVTGTEDGRIEIVDENVAGGPPFATASVPVILQP